MEELLGLGWVISAYPPTMNVTPKNKKLSLGILQHLEQPLGLGWIISAYPQPWTLHPKWKYGFRHFVTFGTTLGLGLGWGHFSILPTINVAPKNEKLDLGILWHLEQLLGLGWVISAYPPTMNITPKNEKLDLGILQHLEQLLGLGWVIFSIPPNQACHTFIFRVKHLWVRVKHLGLVLGLSTFRVKHWGLGLSTSRVRVECILFRWMTSLIKFAIQKWWRTLNVTLIYYLLNICILYCTSRILLQCCTHV